MMRYLLLTVLTISLFLSHDSGVEAQQPALEKAPQDEEGRFYNPWQERRGHSFLDFLKWQLSKNPFAGEKKNEAGFAAVRPDLKALAAAEGDWFAWLGHSTVLMRVGGSVIITDPVFWDVSFFIKRKAPFPTAPEDLPKVDFVLISHSHYDHLNTASVRFLKERSDPVFITGPGYSGYFRKLGVSKHIEINWSQVYRADGLKITSLPVQHWSKRTVSDTDKLLWCSFLVEYGQKKYYWAGDSGYFPGFKQIGERYGPIDAVFLPIGSYEPRWFMKRNHMNPEESLRAAMDLLAKVFIPIHWGTFDLSDEPLREPLKKLKENYREDSGFTLKTLGHGGVYRP